jgi:hypothetical protein
MWNHTNTGPLPSRDHTGSSVKYSCANNNSDPRSQCFSVLTFRIISLTVSNDHRLLFLLVNWVRRRINVIRCGRYHVVYLREGPNMCFTKQMFVAWAGHTLDEISLSADYPAPGNRNKANKSPTFSEVTMVERPTFFFVFMRLRTASVV